MGYTFKIGNAEPYHEIEDDELYAGWRVKGETSDNAPLFPNDGLTGNGNSRSPSYSGWHDFCEDAEIYDLFYDERGHLIGGHPGCILLKQTHLDVVKASIERQKTRSNKPPGFSGMDKFDPISRSWVPSPDIDVYDSTLARLLWLEFWMEWALTNCEVPAIENT